MTRLLKQALKELSKLPEDEQDAVAAIVLEEVACEARWSAAFRASQDALAALADEALAQRKKGKTTPLAFDKSG
ncbi:MAG: hypothetical protein ACE5LL_04380 [Alphaproteobacteria bacterium]